MAQMYSQILLHIQVNVLSTVFHAPPPPHPLLKSKCQNLALCICGTLCKDKHYVSQDLERYSVETIEGDSTSKQNISNPL